MILSAAAKQNLSYFTLVVLAAIGSIVLYRYTEQKWFSYRHAEVKYDNKDYEAAVALYNKSLDEGMPPSKILINLANSYVAMGNFKQAIVLYKEHLLKNPNDKKVHLELARVLSYAGNFEDSEKEYKQTLKDIHDQTN